MTEPICCNIGNFFKYPYWKQKIDEVIPDIGIIGIPFDGGSSYRTGARFAPSAIRKCSVIVREEHNPLGEKMLLNNFNIYDFGDINIIPNNADKTLDKIAHTLNSFHNNIVGVGGDHTITLGILRSIVKRSGPVALIQFDAHDDLDLSLWDEPCFHGSWARIAAQENLILKDCWFRIGARSNREANSNSSEFSITVFDVEQSITNIDIVKNSLRTIENRPTYITIDLDVLDSSVAPAVSTPVPGGFNTRELYRILKIISNYNVVGGDIVEYVPSYDINESTGIIAAYLLQSIIISIAKNFNR